MTTPEPTATTVARAAPEIRRILVRSAVTWSLIAAALMALGVFVPLIRMFGVVLALGSIAYIVYVVVYLRRALIEFGGGRYRAREVTTDVRFSASDAKLVIPIDDFLVPAQPGPALVVVGTSGRGLVEITAASFGKLTLEALVSDLLVHGAPIEHLTGRVTPAQFAQRFPGVLSFPAAHPSAFGWIVASVIASIGMALTAALGLLP
jgi:hypothetical protein